jgi:uncharacterized membrane protein YozB (DUF420 family)
VNAALNGLAALWLGAGYLMIRRRRTAAHRFCMIAALVASAAFLVSYLAYHARAGSTRFTGTGWIRSLYLVILFTHTVLAAAIVPLVLITLRRALRGRFDRHRRIARWTWPHWIYVSVTGVVIYLMLYHLGPALGRTRPDASEAAAVASGPTLPGLDRGPARG